jgi:hypothetical protein
VRVRERKFIFVPDTIKLYIFPPRDICDFPYLIDHRIRLQQDYVPAKLITSQMSHSNVR